MKQPEILYQDDTILVCVKPAKVATQTSRVSEPDLVSILKNELYKADRTKEPYLAVIHRLDQPVSGILVFAKTKKAAAELSRQLQKDGFAKEYLALVTGRPMEKRGVLVDWLRKDGRTNTSCVVPEGTADARRAELSYEVIEEKNQTGDGIPEEISLVRIHLKTGRHHQIRVQMAHAGYPLLGDTRYHPEAAKGSREGKWQQIALCAYRLTFRHPKTGKQLTFEICPEFLARRQGNNEK